jgi:hypothetical protein
MKTYVVDHIKNGKYLLSNGKYHYSEQLIKVDEVEDFAEARTRKKIVKKEQTHTRSKERNHV